MKSQKIVIVGGNAAGMSCASKAARSNNRLDISVYQSGGIVSYSSCGIPYYVGGLVESKSDLIAKNPEYFSNELGIDMHLNCRVKKIQPDSKKIIVLDELTGKEFEDSYDKLVIAVGAKPAVPGFLSSNLKNIFTATKIEDAGKIKTALDDESVKDVIIAGSGYIGIEMLENIIKLGKRIRIIDRNDRILHTFDKEITDIISSEVDKYENVSVHTGESLEAFIGKNRVEAVKTDKGVYEADVVIMALGIQPDTEILKDSGIEMLKNGAIVVDIYMNTSLTDIYAAGDCASVYHRILGENQYIALGTVANKQGKILGENLAGSYRDFPGVIGSVVTRIMNLTVARTGIGEADAIENNFDFSTHFVKTRDHAGYYPDWSRLYIKLIYENGTRKLLGAQMAGEKGVALRVDVLATAIQNNMTLEEIGYLDLVYAPPFSGVWDAVNIAANSAK